MLVRKLFYKKYKIIKKIHTIPNFFRMFSFKVPSSLASKKLHHHDQQLQQKRYVQVSIIGAASEVGSKVALKMKQNTKVTKLKLYDFEDKVLKVAKDLEQLPGGPTVTGYVGGELRTAITMSHLILMLHNTNPSNAPKNELAYVNAPAVNEICKAISERNPDAILGITTKPINTMVPFASAMLTKYNSFNPFKVLGVANIDVARAKSFAAQALNANPRHLSIPVIGGRSEQTVVPLFSNLKPNFYFFDNSDADKLTHQVRKADIFKNQRGVTPTSVALAWSINDWSEKIIDAIRGSEVDVPCYSANPGFGTRFFSSGVTVGPMGLTRTYNNFQMSPLECDLLIDSIQHINEDVALGESMASQYT